ncbi:MtnX-like HAD-IB family phosphatase [Paenibacillus sp. MBLB4367]|uniref:MtnX-like HAD-IB family phosphatase n=1 Tax=Paenibacillus sp. MBLB4367 TaxID=3384767 RepID=UPI00390832A0
MNNLVIVTDFDGTLMKEDVGDILMKELGVMERPETQEVTRKFIDRELGTMKWIEVAYSFLEGKQKEVDALLENVSPRQGALRFLDFCSERGIPVIILSDGMAYYIEKLTRKFDIQVQEVISNPIRYLPDGGYSLGFQNPNESCRWCGCCKADAVRRVKETGSKVVYIGDGVSDLYGSGFADWIFARHTLARFLTDSGEQYYPFETFDDILDVFARDYEAFSEGTAARKRSIENTFCRFA